MSKEISARPSAIWGCRSPLGAFYFDRVVMNVGTAIDGEIEKAQNKSKSERGAAMKAQLVLNRWLRTEGGARYRDPAAR